MRIGMILDSSFPPDVRVENEALSLIQAGHEVYLFSLDFARRSGEENYKNIHIFRYPAGQLLYKLSALVYTIPLYTWIVSRLIGKFISISRIDVIHVHDMVIAEAVFRANRQFNLPVVLDLHENRPEIMKAYKHVNRLSGKILINLERWRSKYYELIRKASNVVVVTDAARQDILTKTNKPLTRIAVVPNTVKISEFLSYPIDPRIVDRMKDFFNLLYLGDTSLRRGTDTAIRAVSMIKNKIPEIRLWLVGKSSADGELKRLCSELDVSRHVIFEGSQDPSLLLTYVQNAQVTLSPLKRNLHHDTTYANKLFQYMVCGKPVVVSDCTAQAKLVESESCGLVHKADDHESLAEKILYLRNQPTDSHALGARGKIAVHERWNWDVTVMELVLLYEGLANVRQENEIMN